MSFIYDYLIMVKQCISCEILHLLLYSYFLSIFGFHCIFSSPSSRNFTVYSWCAQAESHSYIFSFQRIKTDIVICRHDDYFLVSYCNSNWSNGDYVTSQPMLVACVRQLIEEISVSGSYKPLLISLGLKDHPVETMKGIVTAVTDNRLW
ncbi:uncharacterized protein LOC103498075 isoform X1 [Cucumis melo]|uniref:Uncharacterized protein LOC103498075 isoform X1 n=1 Tax=Cucumis melo TaxID=3656 RepID=A0ABM3L6D9_CUCME|nr:uncharacterized protein LOC103498075 isoform X1 [Cucumis melo]